ncbi:MAG TPA: peptidoglycan DD-metalloendopeptidase family protein [Acidimicrobiia bacterium]
MRSRAMRLLIPILLVAVVVAISSPALSVTQGQVDAACADSKEAYTQYKEDNARYEAATERYQLTISELEQTVLTGNYLRTRVEEKTGELTDIHARIQERAVEMYISSGTSLTDMLFASTSVGDFLAGRQFIETATERDVASLDNLQALRNDLTGLREQLKAEEQRLAELRNEQEIVKDDLEEVAQRTYSAWEKMSARCKELYNKRQAELAAAAAAAAIRRGGSAGGVGAAVTPNFFCPMDPGPTHFINDWGFPRSGGRTHKGTDMFAAYGQKVYAAGDGVVFLTNSNLGGRSVWLSAEHGVAYYYAHLSGWAPGLNTGDIVSRGELIGYNGDSGNARGGSPHVHVQIHPGGRGAAPVNPYPTLIAFGCR